jgi:hypothetical protein
MISFTYLFKKVSNKDIDEAMTKHPQYLQLTSILGVLLAHPAGVIAPHAAHCEE